MSGEISDEVINFFENLDTQTEEVTEETPAETAETTEETTASKETTETVETTEQTSEETPSEDPEPDPDPDPEPDNWETRYKNLQSQKDKEVAAVQQQLTQMQEWAQQQYAYVQQVAAQQQAAQEAVQQQQIQQSTHVSAEELAQGVDQDLKSTFQWTVLNRPDLVPVVTALASQSEKHGPIVAEQMRYEYQQYQLAQVKQDAEARVAQVEQRYEGPAQVEATMGQILEHVSAKHGETFNAMKEEVAQRAMQNADSFKAYMQQSGQEITPQAIADYISQTYFDVREEKLTTAAAEPRRAQELSPVQHVESSTSQTSTELTSDEAAINELMQGAMALGIDVTRPAS